jgi:hypothetical protein
VRKQRRLALLLRVMLLLLLFSVQKRRRSGRVLVAVRSSRCLGCRRREKRVWLRTARRAAARSLPGAAAAVSLLPRLRREDSAAEEVGRQKQEGGRRGEIDEETEQDADGAAEPGRADDGHGERDETEKAKHERGAADEDRVPRVAEHVHHSGKVHTAKQIGVVHAGKHDAPDWLRACVCVCVCVYVRMCVFVFVCVQADVVKWVCIVLVSSRWHGRWDTLNESNSQKQGRSDTLMG